MTFNRWTRLFVVFFNTSTITLNYGRVAAFASRAHLTRWSYCSSKIFRAFFHSSTGDVLQTEAVQRYVQSLLDEYKHNLNRLQEGNVSDSDRRSLTRRQVDLSAVVNAFTSIQDGCKDLADVELLIRNTADSSEEDKQMLELLREEQIEIVKRTEALKKQLIQTLVPSDEHDSNNVILEVAAGRTTGGDICQQFTREMFDMYQGFANHKDWEWEVFNYTPADFGGLHHAAVRVSGEEVYRWLKFEGGTHRVQRIPEVGLSSRMQRIHTGTMTVIVLPQPSDVDISIDPKDLRIDTFRSRGAGGQSVNTTDSAVRIVHVPTGVVAECQQSRSQLQNRDTAMRVLRARLYQNTLSQQTEQRHTARKQQVGTRSQSERIRTYNFSQDRVTDHRIGYVTRYIKEFMKGEEALEELISELQEHSEQEALLELVEASMPPSQGRQGADPASGSGREATHRTEH